MLTVAMQVNDNVLESVGLWVLGKSERSKGIPAMLLLHRDFDVPELDGLAHLQAHIAAAGITDGCFFPCKKWFDNGRRKAHQKPITYNEFRGVFQSMCKRLLKREGPFGLHTFRKTGYLLGHWYSMNCSLYCMRLLRLIIL